jgi:hypothetical protein
MCQAFPHGAYAHERVCYREGLIVIHWLPARLLCTAHTEFRARMEVYVTCFVLVSIKAMRRYFTELPGQRGNELTLHPMYIL